MPDRGRNWGALIIVVWWGLFVLMACAGASLAVWRLIQAVVRVL